MFEDLDEGIIGLVRYCNGSTVKIKGKVTIYFMCKIVEEITFHEVYYIPTFCNNIISSSTIRKMGTKL